MQDIVAKLDELAEKQRELEAKRAIYNKAREAILEKVKDELACVDAEYIPSISTADTIVNALTADVKYAVVEHGESVKGAWLHAVYSKGRVTWDNKVLDGLMIAFPQLSEACKQGEPSVAIRASR